MREIKLKMRTNAVPIDLSEAEYRADNLVTCKEFMTALKTETNGGKMNRRNREPSSQLYHRIASHFKLPQSACVGAVRSGILNFGFAFGRFPDV